VKLKQIETRLRRLAEIAEKTDDPNTYNVCMNRICVLELMLERWYSDWYDEESDFAANYKNTVEDIVEAEFED